VAIKYGLLALGLLAAIAFLPRLFGRLRTTTDTGWIAAEDLNRQIGSGNAPVVVDVRGGDEFTGPLGHISSALNIPLGDIPKRLSEIKAHGSGSFILVCKTDKRSAQAAMLLKDAGFEDLRVLRGGMEQWCRSGFQVAQR
jgi:rhodanese-related sulfurtransferase